MTTWLETALTSPEYMPHGVCYLWSPSLLWLHVISDILIGISYYLIPIILIYFLLKRRDIPFNWIFFLFAAFILACGTTHFMAAWTVWVPSYWASGILKAITAIVSIITGILLIPILPKALELPSRARISEDLKNSNQELRDNQTRLQLSMEAVQAGTWMWGSKQQLVQWDNRTLTMMGMDANSEIASLDSWRERIHPEDLAMFESAAIDSATLGQRFDQDFRMQASDSKWRTFNAKADVVRDASGQETRLIGMCMDITERKQAEEELQNLRNYLVNIIDSMPWVTHEFFVRGQYTKIQSNYIPFSSKI